MAIDIHSSKLADRSNNPMIGDRLATISDPTGASTSTAANVDTKSRAAINLLIDRLQDHGLIA